MVGVSESLRRRSVEASVEVRSTIGEGRSNLKTAVRT